MSKVKIRVANKRNPSKKLKDWDGWSGVFSNKAEARTHMKTHFCADRYSALIFGLFEYSSRKKIKWNLIKKFNNKLETIK